MLNLSNKQIDFIRSEIAQKPLTEGEFRMAPVGGGFFISLSREGEAPEEFVFIASVEIDGNTVNLYKKIEG